MLEYKTKGKISCTQPRINVTKNNALTISNELGVPININNSNINIIKEDKKKNIDSSKIFEIINENFYVQYKYSSENHILNKCAHLTLKILSYLVF